MAKRQAASTIDSGSTDVETAEENSPAIFFLAAPAQAAQARGSWRLAAGATGALLAVAVVAAINIQASNIHFGVAASVEAIPVVLAQSRGSASIYYDVDSNDSISHYDVLEGGPAPPMCTIHKTADSGYNVAVVFSGRQDRMNLLVRYMDRLVQECKLHEVHLWDFSRNDEDIAWLRTISSHPGYTLMTGFPQNWGVVYRYYSASEGGIEPRFAPRWPGATKDSTVLIKIDDDVIYMDISRFEDFTHFVRTHPEKFLVQANVVNNGVAAYYQAQHFSLLGSEFPELHDYPIEDGTPGMIGPLLQDDYISSNLLWMFLTYKDDFSWEVPDQDNCIFFEMPKSQLPKDWHPGQGRFSVNCFALRWASMDKASHLVAKYHNDDEHALTTMATKDYALHECMYTPFNVVHYKYWNQRHPEELLRQFAILQQRELGIHFDIESATETRRRSSSTPYSS